MLKSHQCLFAIMIAMSLIASASAQGPRDGGGPSFGRPPFGGGGDDRGGGPSSFLSRLDTNGNGMLDPNEAQGPAAFMLQRMAENNSRIDLSRPIPLDRITEEFSRMREQWSRGGGPSDRSSGDNQSSGGPSSASAPAENPLVPGFDIEGEVAMVPGFGREAERAAELSSIKTNDDDRRDAQRAFGYYDQNRDGILNAEEMSRSRSGDLQQYDKNRDGKLTLDEMAVRYAQRRMNSEQTSSRSSSTSSGPSSRSGSSERSSSDPREDWRSRFGGGQSGDGGFQRFGFGGGDRFGRRDEGNDRGGSDSSRSFFGSRDRNSSSSSSSAKDGSTGTVRLTTTAERLAKLKLPSWFFDKDKNEDGQVAMAEFASEWSDSVVHDFRAIDRNYDGIITPDECLAAATSGSSYASTTRTSSTRTPSSTSQTSSSSADSAGSGSSESTPSAGGVDPRYLSYAAGRIKQFDTNGDGVLQPDEWAKMQPDPPDAADTDGNKQITAEEFAVHLLKR